MPIRTQNKTSYKYIRAVCLVMISVNIICMVFLSSVSGSEIPSNIGTIPVDSSFSRNNDYDNYREIHSCKPYGKEPYAIYGRDFILRGDYVPQTPGVFEGLEKVAVITESDLELDYNVNVDSGGLYTISLHYFCLPDHRSDIELAIRINDEYLFNESEALKLRRIWKDESEITQDNRGNDLRSSVTEGNIWQEYLIKDAEGYFNEPFLYYFEPGENRITLEIFSAGFALSKILLEPPKETEDYLTVLKTHQDFGVEDTNGHFIKVQAENSEAKSSPNLIPGYDRSTPSTEPNSPFELKLNVIGGLSWKTSGDWISWIIEVEDPGFYQIGIKYRQNIVRGFYTNRKIYIDGEVPFKEAEQIKFNYSNSWQINILGDTSPYLFYLDSGKHEIRMEATTGDISGSLRRLENSVYELNDLYRRLVMIMGTNPDIYRDYQIDREISDYIEILQRNSNLLKSEAAIIAEKVGSNGSEASQLEGIAFQLESIIKKPDSIKERLASFKSNVSAIAAWILEIKNQPLELDYIFVKSPDQPVPEADASFWEKFIYSIREFTSSFIVDYSTIGNVYDKDQALRVWIFGGRDQAQIAKNMIDDQFTSVTSVPVNLELVQAGVIEAILSGVNPDVIMNLDRNDPVNLAARNALRELDSFKDFSTVKERFTEEAVIPYTFNDRCYGLPVQHDFNVMFYRADILSELQLSIPTTWQDFYKLIPELQRSNLQIGIPVNQDIFAALLMQNGGQFYDEKREKTLFHELVAVEAFEAWTDFFADYSFPIQYDFFNRFRTGEMPLAIQPYSAYNMLMVGAPEIRGLWGFAAIPGTVTDNGTLDISTPSNGTACVILRNSSMHDDAWRFIKWWTDAPSQMRYGTELETLVGTAARYNTANTKALTGLPWKSQELSVLMRQRTHVREVPEIPASYYVKRSLNNAFRRVLYNYGTNPREVLFDYNTDINNEITRKNNELNTPEGKN